MFQPSHRKAFLALLATVIFGWTQLAAFPIESRNSASPSEVEARATATPNGVLIEWGATFSSHILGFNVYRTVGGTTQKLNESLIAGPTLLAGPRSPSFAWFDRTGTRGSEYEVETIDIRGETAGRVTAVHSYANALPQYRQSGLLADIGEQKISPTAHGDWFEDKEAMARAMETAGDSSSSNNAVQWGLANQPALKISIRADGWYRVTQSQMSAAGFDVNGDARNLQLFAEGVEQSITGSRDSGAMSANDFIEFWGRGLDTPTTDTRIYWLVNGTQPGKRITPVGEIRPSQAPFESRVFITSIPGSVNQSFWFPFTPALSTATSETSPKSREVTASSDSQRIAIPEIVELKDVVSARIGMPRKPAQSNVTTDLKPSPAVRTLTIAPSASAAKPTTPPEFVRVPRKAAASRNATRSRMKRRTRRTRRSRTRHHGNPATAAEAQPAFSYVAEYKNRSIYYTAALNGDHENFFGPVIFGNGATVILNLKNIEKSSASPAQLQVSIQGVTLGQHQLSVTVNGATAGFVSWMDTTSTTQTLSIPVAWLVEGDNLIKFIPASTTNDTSLLDSARITYSHSFRADNDSLQFSIKATQTARIEGFTTANIRVLDVTDPNSVQEVRPIVEGSGASFAATVPGGERGKARRLIAIPADRISQPTSVALNQPSTLNGSTNSADLVIISYRDFIPSLAPLVAQRQAQGYVVKVVDVEDVFDEFSFGEHSPQALRDLMLLARNLWTRSPSYLLLMGDASFDPRNYGGAGNFDFVPTKLVDTGLAGAATALETASDDWFTDFAADGIADISTGRLPVRSGAEANLIVSKIVNYSPANAGNRALLVADSQDSYYFNFEAADDQVAGVLPAGMTVQKVYRRLQPSDADAKANIIASLNSGQSVTVYSGHGNVTFWRGSIFTASDAMGLTSGNRLSFVVVMDCLNGYFADPTLRSLAESFIAAPNGGAVASFASSGLTFPDGQHEMGLRMFQLLYSGSPMAIGDASRQAKSATSDMDVRRTWILFGDPTLKIR
jgi:Peptidase family C25